MAMVELGARGARRLAQAVVDRRGEVLLTQEQLAESAGISPDRIYAIEHAKAVRYSTRIVGALERALRWPAGSVRRIAKGEPIETPRRLPMGLDVSTATDDELRQFLAYIHREKPGLLSDVMDSIIRQRATETSNGDENNGVA